MPQGVATVSGNYKNAVFVIGLVLTARIVRCGLAGIGVLCCDGAGHAMRRFAGVRRVGDGLWMLAPPFSTLELESIRT